MAVCDNCGAVTNRLRSRWTENGIRLPDECNFCTPQSFEKFIAPSDKKIWMGYEAHPNEYVRAADGGFDRKPEYRAEQEAKLCQETEDERILRLEAERHKRATRRTEPMRNDELLAALNKARIIAEAVDNSQYDA